jgi:hypothetical protein
VEQEGGGYQLQDSINLANRQFRTIHTAYWAG